MVLLPPTVRSVAQTSVLPLFSCFLHHLGVHSREFEVSVIDFFARLWRAFTDYPLGLRPYLFAVLASFPD